MSLKDFYKKNEAVAGIGYRAFTDRVSKNPGVSKLLLLSRDFKKNKKVEWRKKTLSSQYKDLLPATKDPVAYRTFCNRIKAGEEPQEAITLKVRNKVTLSSVYKKYSKTIEDPISYKGFCSRMSNYGLNIRDKEHIIAALTNRPVPKNLRANRTRLSLYDKLNRSEEIISSQGTLSDKKRDDFDPRAQHLESGGSILKVPFVNILNDLTDKERVEKTKLMLKNKRKKIGLCFVYRELNLATRKGLIENVYIIIENEGGILEIMNPKGTIIRKINEEFVKSFA